MSGYVPSDSAFVARTMRSGRLLAWQGVPQPTYRWNKQDLFCFTNVILHLLVHVHDPNGLG